MKKILTCLLFIVAFAIIGADVKTVNKIVPDADGNITITSDERADKDKENMSVSCKKFYQTVNNMQTELSSKENNLGTPHSDNQVKVYAKDGIAKYEDKEGGGVTSISVNGKDPIKGDIDIKQGENITLIKEGNAITISSIGGGDSHWEENKELNYIKPDNDRAVILSPIGIPSEYLYHKINNDDMTGVWVSTVPSGWIVTRSEKSEIYKDEKRKCEGRATLAYKDNDGGYARKKVLIQTINPDQTYFVFKKGRKYKIEFAIRSTLTGLQATLEDKGAYSKFLGGIPQSYATFKKTSFEFENDAPTIGAKICISPANPQGSVDINVAEIKVYEYLPVAVKPETLSTKNFYLDGYEWEIDPNSDQPFKIDDYSKKITNKSSSMLGTKIGEDDVPFSDTLAIIITALIVAGIGVYVYIQKRNKKNDD